MKKLANLWGIIVLLAVIGVSILSCIDGTDNGNTPVNVPDMCSDCGNVIHECICVDDPIAIDPVASDFIIDNLTQTAGSVTAVTVTPKTGKLTGKITVFYNGSTTLPIAVGTYTVTFNVAATTGWNAVNGLSGGTLTVNVANGSFGSPAEINITYTSTLTLADLVLPTGYTWNSPATKLNAGNEQQFSATYTDPNGNYAAASGNITVNVAKANGVFDAPSVINTTYTPTLTLENLSLPNGYAWSHPATVLSAGNGEHFPATYADPSGNYTTANGNILVNVAKANGVFGTPSAINITYEPMLTLADLSLPLGYTWNNPTTSLNVGSGQQFSATNNDPSGNYESATGNITINVAEASADFPALAEINATFTPTLTLANITLPSGYTWNNPSTILDAGNSQHFSATYTAPDGNYKPVNGNITVNVAKAIGVFQNHPVIYITYEPLMKLEYLTLQHGYSWEIPTTNLNAGNGQSFPATYNDPSGNYLTASGSIIVNVAKAAGTFGNPSAFNTTYTPTLTLANLTLPNGYVWSSPTTSLNAGNGQQFSATYIDSSGNYEPASGNITVNVAKAIDLFGYLSTMNYTYTPNLTLNNLSLPSGYSWNDPTTSLNAGSWQTFPATYTNPNGNYEPASGNITINIAKATGATVDVPIVASITQNSITICEVIAPINGQTVEYARNTNNTTPSWGWQTDLSFYGLAAGFYYIFARSASNNNYEIGTAVSILVEISNAGIIIENPSITIYLHGSPLENKGTTMIDQGNGNYTVSIGAGVYSSIIWYVNGSIITQGTTVTSLTLLKRTLGIYQITVEATPIGGVKDSGSHTFIVQ